MSSSEAAIIAGLSAFGGGVIVAASNYAVAWLQGRQARKAELQRVLIRLWSIVSRIDHQLRSEPPAGETERKINEAISSRAPIIDYNLGRLSRRLLQPHLDAFVVEMNNALAEATVLAPQKLLPAILALTEAMDEAESRDPEWQERWNSARTEYFLQCRELLRSGVERVTTRAEGAPDYGKSA
jgi:hypothetical protein